MKKISEFNKYCPPETLEVISNGSFNGIDTSFFNPQLFSDRKLWQETRDSMNIPANDLVYCFIGRMVNKGVGELVEAFMKINMHNRNTKLLLVGPFERELDFEIIKENILNHPSIIWRDFQTDVRPYLSISDIFVFPSYREGFPNVVMQAGAMNLPCIVTDISGSNKIIQHGINGIIVAVKNIKALQSSMERLVLNADLRRKLSVNARQMIIGRYGQHYVINKRLKEYSFFTNN